MKRFLILVLLLVLAGIASSYVKKLTASGDMGKQIPADKIALTVKNDLKEGIRVFPNNEKGFLVNPGKSFTSYLRFDDTLSVYDPNRNGTYTIHLNDKSKALLGMEITTTVGMLDKITQKVVFEQAEFVEERGNAEFYNVIFEAVTPYGGD